MYLCILPQPYPCLEFFVFVPFLVNLLLGLDVARVLRHHIKLAEHRFIIIEVKSAFPVLSHHLIPQLIHLTECN